MERRCKNCKFFFKDSEANKFGSCNSDKFVYTNCYRAREELELGLYSDDILIYSSGDGFDSPPIVTENFGCIHFEEKGE